MLPAWIAYSVACGTAATGAWVVAHECGHGAFSNNRQLQDAVGFVLHVSCLSRESAVLYGDVCSAASLSSRCGFPQELLGARSVCSIAPLKPYCTLGWLFRSRERTLKINLRMRPLHEWFPCVAW